MLADIRYALRGLLRRPGFSIVVILTLALGIGATSAVYTLVHGILIEPLPLRDADRVAVLWGNIEGFGRETASLPDFRDWRDQSKSFESMGAVVSTWVNLEGDGDPERLDAALISANYFSTMGVDLILGSGFTPDDESGGAAKVILSEDLWRRKFDADPSVIGKSVMLNSRARQIVGVAPASIPRPYMQQLYVPLNVTDTVPGRRADFLHVVGRLEPGSTIAAAQAEMSTIASRLTELYPQTNTGITVDVVSLEDEIVGGVRTGLLLFMGAVALVLLIACANVANLLLARAATREREIAIRAALGAGQGRLVRQMLTESLVLSLIGAGAGLLLAVWVIAALQRGAPDLLPLLDNARVDFGVVAFTTVVALLVGFLFGAFPSVKLARGQLANWLREGTRAISGGMRIREARGALILAEVAVAVVLLVGAGLLIRSFGELQRVSLGFSTEHVMTANLLVPGSRAADAAALRNFSLSLDERLRAAPGFQATGLTTTLPLSGGGNYLSFVVEGRPPLPPGTNQDAQTYSVSPGYLETMAIPVIRGRGIETRDADGAPRVTVINQTMANRYWPDSDPIGQRITFDGPDSWATIVGIVGDTRVVSVGDEPYAQAYMPFAQRPSRVIGIAARYSGDMRQAAAQLRRVVKDVDPSLPVAQVQSMDEYVATSLARPRVSMLVLGTFAAVALALAAIGIYGITTFAVSQRTREIGVRVALGAARADVIRMIVRQGMIPVLTGLAIGTAGAWAATRAMRSVLYGISNSDPVTYVAMAIFLSVVAFVAALIPARRATRVDPVEALRSEG